MNGSGMVRRVVLAAPIHTPVGSMNSTRSVPTPSPPHPSHSHPPSHSRSNQHNWAAAVGDTLSDADRVQAFTGELQSLSCACASHPSSSASSSLAAIDADDDWSNNEMHAMDGELRRSRESTAYVLLRRCEHAAVRSALLSPSSSPSSFGMPTSASPSLWHMVMQLLRYDTSAITLTRLYAMILVSTGKFSSDASRTSFITRHSDDSLMSSISVCGYLNSLRRPAASPLWQCNWNWDKQTSPHAIQLCMSNLSSLFSPLLRSLSPAARPPILGGALFKHASPRSLLSLLQLWQVGCELILSLLHSLSAPSKCENESKHSSSNVLHRQYDLLSSLIRITVDGISFADALRAYVQAALPSSPHVLLSHSSASPIFTLVELSFSAFMIVHSYGDSIHKNNHNANHSRASKSAHSSSTASTSGTSDNAFSHVSAAFGMSSDKSLISMLLLAALREVCSCTQHTSCKDCCASAGGGSSAGTPVSASSQPRVSVSPLSSMDTRNESMPAVSVAAMILRYLVMVAELPAQSSPSSFNLQSLFSSLPLLRVLILHSLMIPHYIEMGSHQAELVTSTSARASLLADAEYLITRLYFHPRHVVSLLPLLSADVTVMKSSDSDSASSSAFQPSLSLYLPSECERLLSSASCGHVRYIREGMASRLVLTLPHSSAVSGAVSSSLPPIVSCLAPSPHYAHLVRVLLGIFRKYLSIGISINSSTVGAGAANSDASNQADFKTSTIEPNTAAVQQAPVRAVRSLSQSQQWTSLITALCRYLSSLILMSPPPLLSLNQARGGGGLFVNFDQSIGGATARHQFNSSDSGTNMCNIGTIRQLQRLIQTTLLESFTRDIAIASRCRILFDAAHTMTATLRADSSISSIDGSHESSRPTSESIVGVTAAMGVMYGMGVRAILSLVDSLAHVLHPERDSHDFCASDVSYRLIRSSHRSHHRGSGSNRDSDATLNKTASDDPTVVVQAVATAVMDIGHVLSEGVSVGVFSSSIPTSANTTDASTTDDMDNIRSSPPSSSSSLQIGDVFDLTYRTSITSPPPLFAASSYQTLLKQLLDYFTAMLAKLDPLHVVRLAAADVGTDSGSSSISTSVQAASASSSSALQSSPRPPASMPPGPLLSPLAAARRPASSKAALRSPPPAGTGAIVQLRPAPPSLSLTHTNENQPPAASARTHCLPPMMANVASGTLSAGNVAGSVSAPRVRRLVLKDSSSSALTSGPVPPPITIPSRARDPANSSPLPVPSPPAGARTVPSARLRALAHDVTLVRN